MQINPNFYYIIEFFGGENLIVEANGFLQKNFISFNLYIHWNGVLGFWGFGVLAKMK